MIHKAAREYALDRFGPEAWEAIAAHCGFGSEHFISGQHYPDEVTVSLIGAIAEKAGIGGDEMLTEFGRTWVPFTAKSDYAAILDMSGDDLVSFLRNLDMLHTSVAASMPKSRMPSLAVARAEDGEIELIYRSHRTGLAPFVLGLLEALMDRFGERGTVSYEPAGGDTLFRIALERAA